jgi:hypothetical protein
MIHNEQKKWFLYSTLPPSINRLFIYMPTANNPMAEKALEELTEYLKNDLGTIGKVTRVDTVGEGFFPEEEFPVIVFDRCIINHNLTDIAKAVSNYLPVVDVDLPVAERVKALKDGRDLL